MVTNSFIYNVVIFRVVLKYTKHTLAEGFKKKTKLNPKNVHLAETNVTQGPQQETYVWLLSSWQFMAKSSF